MVDRGEEEENRIVERNTQTRRHASTTPPRHFTARSTARLTGCSEDEDPGRLCGLAGPGKARSENARARGSAQPRVEGRDEQPPLAVPRLSWSRSVLFLEEYLFCMKWP